MKVYLASASPRRKELLKQVGISFKTMPSTVEEKSTKTEPNEVVEELSCRMREIGNKSIIPGLQAWRSNIMGQLTMRVSKAPFFRG